MSLDQLVVRTERLGAASQSLVLRPEDFHLPFARPTAPLSLPVQKLRGRCGDAVVVQIRGASGAGAAQEASLRSLGLGRPRQASLRWFSDDVTRGYLRRVQHLVGVVPLAGSCYKESIEHSFESHQYGTPSKPGEIWRTHDGEYVGFVADRENVQMFMSTAVDLPQLLVGLQECNLEPELSSASWLSILRRTGEWDSRRGQFTSIMDGVDLSEVVAARFGVKTYGRMSPDTELFRVSWRRDIQKFHDKERVAHEIGVLASVMSVARLSRLKDEFAEPVARESCRLTIPIKRQGRRVDVVI